MKKYFLEIKFSKTFVMPLCCYNNIILINLNIFLHFFGLIHVHAKTGLTLRANTFHILNKFQRPKVMYRTRQWSCFTHKKKHKNSAGFTFKWLIFLIFHVIPIIYPLEKPNPLSLERRPKRSYYLRALCDGIGINNKKYKYTKCWKKQKF